MKFLIKILSTTFLSLLLSNIVFSQGFLHRNGKYIYDGSNNEVILRGIGTGNWMLQEGYMMQTSDVAGTQHEFRAKLVSTIGEAKTDSFYTVWLDSHFRRIDVDSMKSWGFNSVGLPCTTNGSHYPLKRNLLPGSKHGSPKVLQ